MPEAFACAPSGRDIATGTGDARLAPREMHHVSPCRVDEMHGLAGRLVETVDEALGALRQIDLSQARVAEFEDAAAERVGAPARRPW